MTLLDKIKLIDFYLHDVDRGVKKSFTIKFDDEGNQEHFYTTEYFDDLNYHTSLDALRPVIVKLYKETTIDKFIMMQLEGSWYSYVKNGTPLEPVLDTVVECIEYLNQKTGQVQITTK